MYCLGGGTPILIEDQLVEGQVKGCLMVQLKLIPLPLWGILRIEFTTFLRVVCSICLLATIFVEILPF